MALAACGDTSPDVAKQRELNRAYKEGFADGRRSARSRDHDRPSQLDTAVDSAEAEELLDVPHPREELGCGLEPRC